MAGCDGDDGWLMTTDGEGLIGSVVISTCDAETDGIRRGWIGVVEACTAEELKRGAVEVFHGFCDDQEIELACGERVEYV